MSDRERIFVYIIAVLVGLLFLAPFGAHMWGVSNGKASQNAKIKNLVSRLEAEHKKALGWWNIAKKTEADCQKLQSESEIKDSEIATGKTLLEVCKKEVAQLTLPPARPKQVARKVIANTSAKTTAKKTLTPAVTVPASVITPQLILRINVVEWSPLFQGKSLMSRDIGPIIRQGLANGTVVRTKNQCGFIVNGASVVVNDGQAIVGPGPIGPETALTVQPSAGPKFASPPGGIPLTTNPGELDALVKRGSSEIWLNFILAPPSAAIKLPAAGKKNMRGPRGLSSLLLFL